MDIFRWLLSAFTSKPTIRAKFTLIPFYNYISIQTGIPYNFIVAHAHRESIQKTLARGKLNEYGLWQFLPSVWKHWMGNADWKNVPNQAIAYIKHAIWIITSLNLDMTNLAERNTFFWIWNAGWGNYTKRIMPSVTQNYIATINDYSTRVV